MQQTYRYRNIIIKPHWMQFVINELHLLVLISVGFVYAGIDNCRFKRIVRPGDRLDMEVELTKVKGPIIKAQGKAMVDGQLAMSADMIFSVV